MTDALAEAEARAGDLAAAQQGGRFPRLGVGGAAVLGLLLEIVAEAVTDQDQRMAALERQVEAFKDEKEREVAALTRRLERHRVRLARLEEADTRTHPE